MPIDAFTVLVFGLALKGAFGGLFLAFWLRSDGEVWFGWWSAAFALGCAANALYLVPAHVTGDILTVGFANALLIMAFGCGWQAARAFDRLPPHWAALLVPPVLWLNACLISGFHENLAVRVVVSSAVVSWLLGMTALQFWRGRAERLPSRWPVIVLFASFALVFLLRIPMVEVLPFPFGALPMQPAWLGGFNLLMFFHTVILAVLIVSMSKERLEREQRMHAQTDPLTGALNRRAFMLNGTRVLLRHQLEREPLCLLFLDLDLFKSLNDRLGHAGGDDILVRFVTVVQQCIRPSDFLYRIGGEEFCCLLPLTRAAQARQVAERIRGRFETETIHVHGQTVRPTVSVGIAASETFGYDIDTLMRQADMAVYAAKRQGRNRVEVANGIAHGGLATDGVVAAVRRAAR